MASKITIVDDIDGTADNVTTIQFAFDGTHYEIDLSQANFHKMRDLMQPWIDNARKRPHNTTKRRPTRTDSGTATDDGIRLQDVRDWAEAEGIPVSPRGRVAGSIIDAYRNRETVKTSRPRRKKSEPSDVPAFSS